MLRLFFFVCLLATVLTSPYVNAAIKEPVNCQALIQEGLPVTEQTYLNIATQPYVLNRARGEFETKEAFEERTANYKNALLSEVGGGFTAVAEQRISARACDTERRGPLTFGVATQGGK